MMMKLDDHPVSFEIILDQGRSGELAMARTERRRRWVAVILGLIVVGSGSREIGQASGQEWGVGMVPSSRVASSCAAALTADSLIRMSEQQLDALYARGVARPLPEGFVRGVALVAPGKPWAVPASKSARLVWQGKVIRSCDGVAINQFFGLKTIRAAMGPGPSWRDGGPAWILDYQDTSIVYEKNRDEIRWIGPGLYLGRMYKRTKECPKMTLWFVLTMTPEPSCSPACR